MVYLVFSYLNRESSNVQLIKIDSNDEFGNMAKVVNQNIQKQKVKKKKIDWWNNKCIKWIWTRRFMSKIKC